jgi:hypothetical protein
VYTIEPLTGAYPPGAGYPETAAFGLNNRGAVAGEGFIRQYPEPEGVPLSGGAVWQNDIMTFAMDSDTYGTLVNLNEVGIAVGGVQIENPEAMAAIVYMGGNTISLTPQVGASAFAADINSAGFVAGSRSLEPFGSFIYSCQAREVTAWIDGYAIATAINNVNEVVGMNDLVGFCYSAGNMKPLTSQDPALVVAGVFDINDAGSACGSVGVIDGQNPTYFPAVCANVRGPAPTLHPISLPTMWRYGEAYAINNLGAIVGSCWATPSAPEGYPGRAFTVQSGRFVDLNMAISDPGWYLSVASDINDAGQITGWGILNGTRMGFILTPPPVAALGSLSLGEIVAAILGGAPVDGSGTAVVGGQRVPIPPWSPVAAWGQLQAEKQDVLVALALDEIARFIIDGNARETVRKALVDVATARLEGLNLQRGRSGQVTGSNAGGGGLQPTLVPGMPPAWQARLGRFTVWDS